MIDEPVRMALARQNPAAQIDEPRYLAGFTGIGIVVLAAAAYSVRISLDPAAGSNLLTATFLLANITGWLFGSILRTRHSASGSSSMFGLFLVLLGDAIFPLNLFAPLLLLIPITRGNVALSATGVVIVGIAYHLRNYRNRVTARFALPFYPYFFALAAGAGLVLTRQTLGLPMSVVAWLVLAFAIAFNELSYRLRPEPALHFAIAGATILTASLVVSAVAFRARGEAALGAIVLGTIVLVASAIRERNDEAVGRAYGLAAWLGVTCTFTALLYYAGSPLWLYIVATGAWTIALCIVSMIAPRGWTEPFHESAWWTSMLLTAALAFGLWQIWMPFLVRTLGAKPLRGATAEALLEAGIAMLIVSAWRRRYPAIAATLRGFIANNVLLRLTSYAAPLLLIVAATGAWSRLGAPAPADVYVPLIAGTLLLITAPTLTRHYPTEALDFAGVVAMVFAAFNGLGSAMLSACVLFAAGVIFLARYIRGAHVWTFAAFLVMTVGSLALQPIGTPTATAVFAIAAAVIAWGGTRAAGTMARIGYWTAHGAAFVFWLSLARTLGFGRGDDAVIVASWGCFAFAVSRFTRGNAAQTSYHACLLLIVSSLVTMLAEPTGTHVMLASLVIAAALLLELRHLHVAGFALLVIAVALAATRAEGTWLFAALAIAAVVLLRQSLTHGSTFGHFLFTAAALAAAFLAMPHRGPLQALPIAIVFALFLLVELLAIRTRNTSSFHADLTSVMSLLLAVTILVVEISSARFSLYVLVLLFLAVLVIRPLIKASDAHRVQPVVHAAFGVILPVAAALIVVAVAHLAGLTPGQQLFALACSAWLILAWLLRLPRRTVASGATAVALQIIGVGIYVTAFVIRSGDPFLLVACLAVTGAYLVWRAAWKLTLLEHFAAVGIIETICLWGLARHIAWPELYLFAAAAYLCLVLLRRTAAWAENLVAVLLIAAAVAYPYFALLRTARAEHLAFLGIASVGVIHVLLTARRHAVMVFAVCAMLGLGMLFSAVALRGDVRLNLLMALVGFLVIADLGVIGSRSDRQTAVGEIDYDDNRVTR